MNFRFWITVIFFFLVAACRHDEDPKSFITPDEFFNEDRDAQAAIDAIYHHINTGNSIYSEQYWLLNALFSDLATSDGVNPDLEELSQFRPETDNEIIETLWKGLYEGVAKANYAIRNIPDAPLSEDEKNLFLAEARFLRAFFYFDLVRLFGAVPLVEETPLDINDIEFPARTPADTVFQYLESELNFSFQNLPLTSNPGRPTVYTAAAMLCKLYLTTKNYTRAAQASRFLLQGAFVLQNDYAGLFRNNSQNNSEIIWSVNLNPGNGSKINFMTLPYVLGGLGRVLPSASFYDSFENLDHRYQVTFLDQYSDMAGNIISIDPHVQKYWDRSAETIIGNSSIDFPLIRFADILLLHAEALNELRNGSSAEALGAINLVRARARFDGSITHDILPDLGRMDKEEFAEAILEERKRELGWEGHRWFDLVRFGQLEQKVKEAKPQSNVSPTHIHLPIPASELRSNKNLTQNPGY